jgi:high-affinity K+ transport system ATPase subunit B
MKVLRDCRERRHLACMSADGANNISALLQPNIEIKVMSSRPLDAHAGRMPALPATA